MSADQGAASGDVHPVGGADGINGGNCICTGLVTGPGDGLRILVIRVGQILPREAHADGLDAGLTGVVAAVGAEAVLSDLRCLARSSARFVSTLVWQIYLGNGK